MGIVQGMAAAEFAADDERLTPEYLAAQERLGCCRPEWRFAWVGEDGAIRSRVAYWAPPGADRPLILDVVHGDATVAELLPASLAALDLHEIDYPVSRPLDGGRSSLIEPPALEAAGFALVAVQRRLEHTGPVALPPAPPGFTIRSVAAVGYDDLIPAIGAAQAGSLDRGTRDRSPAAELAMLRGLDHEPSWWELAFDPSGRPAGFVLPARTDGDPVIAFIGVVAGARGRGLGRYLLARGTQSLRREAARSLADVDQGNLPMLRACAAVGYRAFASRAYWRLAAS